MGDISNSIKELAQDLTTLEINTIIKPDMSGTTMPRTRHALIDIAKEYMSKLSDLGIPLGGENMNPGSFDSFHRIREKARTGIADLKKSTSKKSLNEDQESDLILLGRIRQMSDQIKGLMKSLEKRGVESWNNDLSREEIENMSQDLPLMPKELVLLRRIWDMGLEHIAMQTIIQLDGDVTTRIQAIHADKDGKVIHSLHTKSVDASIKFWGKIAGMLQDIIKLFFK